MTASVLGDFGADVIKIERPGLGDPLRWNHRQHDVGLFYKVQARNKRCITLNLKSDRGRGIFHELVRGADVFVENFRPGVMERLGNDWEMLRALNPRLVFCRISGWGQDGPHAARPSFGRIAEASCVTGSCLCQGERTLPRCHDHLMAGRGPRCAGPIAPSG
jgi:formyl-CoA transferase